MSRYWTERKHHSKFIRGITFPNPAKHRPNMRPAATIFYLSIFWHLASSTPMMPIPNALVAREFHSAYEHFVDTASDEEVLGK